MGGIIAGDPFELRRRCVAYEREDAVIYANSASTGEVVSLADAKAVAVSETPVHSAPGREKDR